MPREEVAYRLAGHLLVSFMPPIGLPETVETLADYFEFHSAPTRPKIEQHASDLVGRVAEQRDASVPLLAEEG